MWRSKKFIVIALLASAILVGGIGGMVLAADNGEEANSQSESKYGALLDRVCEIYQEKTGSSIDQEVLKDAFSQAQGDMQIEALQNRLQKLVDQGKITQEEADQYQAWQQSKPDAPVGFGPHRLGRFHGMGGPRSWFGRCAPNE
jgi:hypothetical protein